MTQEPWKPKYGVEVIDYEADWTEALDGDTITGDVTGRILGSTTMAIEEITTAAGISRVWISGGGDRASASPRVELVANTAAGRTLAASIPLSILQT